MGLAPHLHHFFPSFLFRNNSSECHWLYLIFIYLFIYFYFMFKYLQNALHYPQGNIWFCLGFFCPFPFDRHWKRCFFLFCFWASLATIVCGGCHRSVSFTVLGETWSELLQLGTQKSCVCLRSLCRPRDSAEQNPNTSQYWTRSGAGSGLLTAAVMEHV